MYSLMIKLQNQKQIMIIGASALATLISLGILMLAFTNSKADTEILTVADTVKVKESASKVQASTNETKTTEISKQAVTETKAAETKATETPASSAAPVVENSEVTNTAPQAEVVQTSYTVSEPTTQQHVASSQTQSYATATSSASTTAAGTLANGNTAGVVGSSAAAQMAAATGVPQSTWEHIIARESNGNPNVSNASGASGLFQTMPGWGSTATVQDQINSAINAYNAQGLSAWGY